MKTKLLFALIPSLLLVSCTNVVDDEKSHSVTSITTSETSSNTEGSLTDTSTSEDTSIATTSSENSSASPSNTADTNTTFNTGDLDDEDEWKRGRQLLDCGYYAMDLPKNSSPINLITSNNSNDWYNNQMLTEMPTNYRYIYKNGYDDGPSNHKASPDFYSYNASNATKYPGGLNIAMKGVGFQTPLFSHTGFKLEIRIGITQVNSANDSVEKGDIAHIYFFNKTGGYLGKYIFSEGSITAQSGGKYLKCYWENNASDVAYFEFRINKKPYKGNTTYNVGIGYCNIKSWLGSK